MSAEPTEAERQQAVEIIHDADLPQTMRARRVVAQALADQRSRYEALANALSLEAPEQEPWDGNCVAAYEGIAERIREIGR